MKIEAKDFLQQILDMNVLLNLSRDKPVCTYLSRDQITNTYEINKMPNQSWTVTYAFLCDRIFRISSKSDFLFQEMIYLKFLAFLGSERVQGYIKKEVDLKMVKLKEAHRSKEYVADGITSLLYTLFSEVFSQAIYNNTFNLQEALYFLNDIEDFPFWKQIITDNKNNKLLSLKRNGPIIYKPWIIKILENMKDIEVRKALDLGFGCYTELDKHLSLILLPWILRQEALLSWLLSFIFRENMKETKRQFLYVHGKPSSGKSFFIDLLCSKMENRYMKAHFYTSLNQGIHEVHTLIYDDIGTLDGKSNRQDTESFLNYARMNTRESDQPLVIPTKGSFALFLRAQFILISNKTPDNLVIDKDLKPAFMTRLAIMEFDLDPFPIRVAKESYNLRLPNFRNMSSEALQSLIFDEYQSCPSNKDMMINEEDDNLFPINEIMQPEMFLSSDDGDVTQACTRDVVYYFLWLNLFRAFQYILRQQTSHDLEVLMPCKKLRQLVLEHKSLYLTLQTTEKEALTKSLLL